MITDGKDLLPDTWKPAEDGIGTILRFIDPGGEPRTTTIHAPLLSIGKIVATDAIERDQKPIVLEDVDTFKIAVRARQIFTIRTILQPIRAHFDQRLRSGRFVIEANLSNVGHFFAGL